MILCILQQHDQLLCALPPLILASVGSVVKIPCLHLRQQSQFFYLSKQQISHLFFFFGLQNCSLNWMCDCVSSTLRMRMNINARYSMWLILPTLSCRDQEPWGMARVKYIPSSVVPFWVMSWCGGTWHGLNAIQRASFSRHVKDAVLQVGESVVVVYTCMCVGRCAKSLAVWSC